MIILQEAKVQTRYRELGGPGAKEGVTDAHVTPGGVESAANRVASRQLNPVPLRDF